MIHLDFETRSECNLWETGAWVYSQHPTTEVIWLSYAVDEEPVVSISRHELLAIQNGDGEPFLCDPELAERCEVLWKAGTNGVVFKAFNSFFEYCIWHNICVKKWGWPRIPIKNWRCVMTKGLARSLPRSLKDMGRALNADVLKSDEGHRVMMKLCKPLSNGAWHEDPNDFEKLGGYCENDVEAERCIDRMLPDLIPSEQTIWFLDQLINSRGIYVDLAAIKRSLEFIEEYSKNCEETVFNVSDGKLDGVSRRMAVLEWCQDQCVPITGYTKADVKATLERGDLPESVRTVLETRVQLGKTSTAKYQAMQESTCSDGRIRDLLIYHGASTGRWAGKLIQLQNLPKGNVKDTDTAIDLLKSSDLNDFQVFYPDVMGTLSSCIRGMITSAPGHDLIVADYNAIEARVVMWLAEDKRGLNQFKNGVDLYVDMARLIYGRSDISSSDRQLGKAAVLGCGYGMGPAKFLATCTAWGIPVTEAVAEKAVAAYRQTYSRVYDSWARQERAAIESLQFAKTVTCGKVTWGMDGTVLYCQLPSNRRIIYNDATLEYTETPWGEKKLAVHFMAANSVTKKWERQHTYGGKIVENITQAVARDILAAAMLRAEIKGYKVAFSVHDEIVSEVSETFGTTEEFEKILCELPPWAKDCPITASGWRGKRYKK